MTTQDPRALPQRAATEKSSFFLDIGFSLCQVVRSGDVQADVIWEGRLDSRDGIEAQLKELLYLVVVVSSVR